MNLGNKIPNLPFNATSDLSGNLWDYCGQWLILYFYPKDATPGCTTEGQQFRDQYAAFKTLNTEIVGISRDSLPSHERFKARQAFPFELISDPNEALCQAFNVIKMKSMYGKEVRGIERSTFLIDPEGILRQEWRKVSVKEHAETLLTALRSMQAA